MRVNVVPARRGWAWAVDGLRVFWRQPVGMSGVFFLFMLSMSVVALVPVLGTLLAVTLMPAATVGMMAASREVVAGRFPRPTLLLTALRQGPDATRAMLTLGALYTAAIGVVLGATVLVDGGQFAKLYVVGGNLSVELLQSESFQRATLVAMALYAPVSMVFWFAPALVHWHRVPPVKSLFFSWVACYRNMSAFVVFALGWAVIGSVPGLALTTLTAVTGAAALGPLLALPAMLMVAAMFFTSIDGTFRDVLGQPGADRVGLDQEARRD